MSVCPWAGGGELNGEMNKFTPELVEKHSHEVCTKRADEGLFIINVCVRNDFTFCNLYTLPAAMWSGVAPSMVLSSIHLAPSFDMSHCVAHRIRKIHTLMYI